MAGAKRADALAKPKWGPLVKLFIDARLQSAMVDILPAILSHTRADLMHKISQVPSAPALHIDLMDGRFVDNATVGPGELDVLPSDKIIEYHLMVREPVEWILQLRHGRERIYEVHVEALMGLTSKAAAEKSSAISDGSEHLQQALKAAKEMGGRLAIAINPPTPIEKVEKMLAANPGITQALVMTVNPGWAGQSYIVEMEEKMRFLRARHPNISIEVDGGVGAKTAPGALAAGADRLAAANALFKAPKPDQAWRELTDLASSRQ